MSKRFMKHQLTPVCLRGGSTALLLTLVLFTMAPGPPLAAQGSSDKGGKAFDLFRTARQGSSFKFSGDFSIPAGFFGEGSQRFSGTVALKGLPLRNFRDHKTGDADVIIERRPRLAPAEKFPSEQKAEIELAALSLLSTAPIKVRVGKRIELWQLKVEASPSHPSIGSVTIKQRDAQGGTADWELTVYPVFTFTRQTDKAEKKLDIGTLKFPPDAESQLTLRARNVSWSTKAPRGTVVDGPSDNFFLGVKGTTIVPVTARSPIIIHIILDGIGIFFST